MAAARGAAKKPGSAAAKGGAGAGGAGAAKEVKENVWTSLLKRANATSKSHEADSTLLVFGDKRNGKGELVRKVVERRESADQRNSRRNEFLLTYSYAGVKNVHDQDTDDVRAHMSVWEVDEVRHLEMLPKLVESSGLGSTVYMFTVDLSRPWSAGESLQRWLKAVHDAHAPLLAALPESKQQELRNRVSRFNQFFVDPSVRETAAQAQPDPSEVKVDASQPKINLGVPVIVVGTKGDELHAVFQAQDGVGDRFEYLTRQLRTMCLSYGAALFFTSSRDSANVEQLREYIYHRLYEFDLVHPARLVGDAQEYAIYVPAGFDSPDLIRSVQPAQASWATDAPFGDVFKDPELKKKKAQEQRSAAAKEEPEVKAEDNQLFFKTLKFNLEKGAPAKKARPKAISRSAASGSSGGPPPVPPAPGGRTTSTSSAGAGKGAVKDQRAVKDFFRSLLSSDQKRKVSAGGGADVRTKAKDALQSLKKDGS